MRDVNNGWLIRYLHSNTASAFFFLVEKCEFSSGLYFYIFTENNSVTTIPLGINIGLLSKLEFSSQGEGNKGSNYPFEERNEIAQTYSTKKPLDYFSYEDLKEWFVGFVYVFPLNKRHTQRSSFNVIPRTPRLITRSVCTFNKKYNTALVVWGTNLTSTVGEKFTLQELRMMQLAPYQYSVVIGLLLSDGWLIFSNARAKNARLGFKQSVKNMSYVFFVFNILSHYCSSMPSLTKSRVRAGKLNRDFFFITRSISVFTELHSIFYVNKVKVIPKDIYNLLTPVALAHIIMGDGSAERHGLVLCTDSFTIPEVIKLMNVLFIRYQLDCTFRLHTPTQPRIYIKEGSMSKLRGIVEPYMHHSLMYKLDKNSGAEAAGILGKNKKNIGVRVLDENGGLIYSFPSVTECALFFNVDRRTINRRIFKSSFMEFKGKKLKFEHVAN